jgi:hypothetical protein
LTVHGNLLVEGEIDAIVSGFFVNGTLTLADDNAIKPDTDGHSSIGEAGKMWGNVYTRGLVMGRHDAQPTPQYLTFSIDESGIDLIVTSTDASGSIQPAQYKFIDLGAEGRL